MALLQPRRNSLAFRPFLVLMLLLTAASGCQPEKALEGRGLLPDAPADQTASAAEPAKAPFDQPLGEGAFARTVFQTTGPSNIAVTVRDVIVGPQAEAPLAAAGPVVIDVNSGSGTASSGGKTLDLSLGNAVSFPAGVAIAVKNTGDTSLVLRLYMLEGK
jgi:quercetin dioxygenase-like cupin family protein